MVAASPAKDKKLSSFVEGNPHHFVLSFSRYTFFVKVSNSFV